MKKPRTPNKTVGDGVKLTTIAHSPEAKRWLKRFTDKLISDPKWANGWMKNPLNEQES